MRKLDYGVERHSHRVGHILLPGPRETFDAVGEDGGLEDEGEPQTPLVAVGDGEDRTRRDFYVVARDELRERSGIPARKLDPQRRPAARPFPRPAGQETAQLHVNDIIPLRKLPPPLRPDARARRQELGGQHLADE